MKNSTLLIVMLVALTGLAQNAPIDFETAGIGANWTWTVFENDDNPPLEIVANPDPSGVNTSTTVAKFTARDLGQPFAGVESMHGADIGTFDLTAANAYVSIKVYKTKISDVGIKFATPSGGAQPEIKVANTLTNQWETITIDFTSYIGMGETTGLDQIIIYPDFVDRTADDIVYFDDITFSDTPPAGGVELPVTFEDPTANYQFVGFEGADSAIESNAVSGGINTSATVMRTTKTVGAQFFAGTALELDNPIDFSMSESISIKSYSPKADIPVKLRLENADNSVGIEMDVTTTVADEWEHLTYNFAGQTAGVDFVRVVIFFEFIDGVPGDGSTYYFDDIQISEVLGVEESKISAAVVYPNPASDIMNVKADNEIKEIRIVSITGQVLIKVFPNQKTAQLSVSSLSSGVYFVGIMTTAGHSETIRFIKQ